MTNQRRRGDYQHTSVRRCMVAEKDYFYTQYFFRQPNTFLANSELGRLCECHNNPKYLKGHLIVW